MFLSEAQPVFHHESIRRIMRDYQDAATLAAIKEFLDGRRSTLIVLPTGCGKTVIFARMASEWQTGNVLVLAHRIELLDQAADKLVPELGYRPPIEQGLRGLDEDMLWQGGNVIVGSVQTMRNIKRMQKYRECPFGLVIVDEAHHATSASYRQILDTCLEFNPNCRVLGVTATPHRADNTALGIVFESVAFGMELQEAIELGWLVGIRQEFVQIDDVDFSNIRMTTNKHGERDFPREELEAILTEEHALHAMAKPILDKSANGQQCLIFNAGVAHAHLMAAVLNRHKDNSAAAVDGKTDKEKRNEIVKDFHRGKLQYLCNFGVFTEGFDCPATSIVFMARPTKSPSLYLQMLGRGTRPLGGVVDGPPTPDLRKAAILASAKPHMLVVDYVGNSRHKPVSTIDALGGNYDVDVRKLAENRIKEKGGDVRDELEKAKADFTLLAEEKIRRQIKASKVDYVTQEVDVFGHGAAPVEQGMEVPRGGCSDQQISLLVGLGVKYETAAGYSRRQAHAVIDSLTKTRCTKRQLNVLKKYGYEMMPFEEAKKTIDRIAANGWKRPED